MIVAFFPQEKFNEECYHYRRGSLQAFQSRLIAILRVNRNSPPSE